VFRFTLDTYTLLCQSDGLPDLYPEYKRHARLVEEIDLTGRGGLCFLAVQRNSDWPFLVVAQRYSPSEAGFWPGALLVPETGLVFIGAGERVLAYQLEEPRRLWEDQADTGFWDWQRHGNFVVMSAELELAAWDIEGRKRWTTFVEPPWDYSVVDRFIHLDVMGKKSSFPLESGPGK
jgi:hypothetical protein